MENLELIAKAPHRGLNQAEMDGRHLRAQDGVILFHLLCEEHAAVRAGNHRFLKMAHFPYADSGDQGAHADSCRS